MVILVPIIIAGAAIGLGGCSFLDGSKEKAVGLDAEPKEIINLDEPNALFEQAVNLAIEDVYRKNKPVGLITTQEYTLAERLKLMDQILRQIARYIANNNPTLTKLSGKELITAQKIIYEQLQKNGQLKNSLSFQYSSKPGQKIIIIPANLSSLFPPAKLANISQQAKYWALPPLLHLERASQLASIHASYAKAITQLNDLVTKCPSSDFAATAYLRIAFILSWYIKDYPQAIKYYQKVVALRPQEAWAAHALHEIATIQTKGLKDYRAATKTLQKIITDFPLQAECCTKAALELGRLYRDNLGDIKTGKTFFRQVIALAPKSILAKNAKRELRRKRILRNHRRECEAFNLESCNHLIATQPNSQQGQLALFFKGLHLLYGSNFLKAQQLFSNFLKRKAPSRTKTFAHYYLGLALKYTGQHQAALKHLKLARKHLGAFLHPSDQKHLFLFFRDGSPSYDHLYSLAYAQLDYEIGDIYARVLNDKARAIRHLKRAYALASEYPNFVSKVIFNIANTYIYYIGIHNNRDFAKTGLSILAEMYNSEIASHWLHEWREDTDEKGFAYWKKMASPAMAQAYYFIGQISKAKRLLKSQNTAAAKVSLGYLQYTSGNKDQAVKTWGQINRSSWEYRLAQALLQIHHLNSPYHLVKEDQLSTEIAVKTYQAGSKNQTSLVFLHGLPTTIVPGQLEFVDGVLTASYQPGNFKVRFYEPHFSLPNNNLVLKTLADIPDDYFSSSTISFSLFPGSFAGGIYIFGQRTTNLYYPEGLNKSSLFHEQAHHFDLGQTGPWFDPFDPSTLFKSISYKQLGTEFWLRSHYNYSDYSPGRSTFPNENITYHHNDYMRGKSFRSRCRKFSRSHNLRPAAKYLFIKELTPMRGKEYQVGKNSPGLDFVEVESRSSHSPKPSEQETLQIIQEIKRRKQWRLKPEAVTCDTRVSF